jgi:hypothetical protein
MKIFKLWNSYWFKPAPLVNLAFVRIIVVGFQTFYLVMRNTPETLLARAALPASLYDPLPALRLLLLPFGSNFMPSSPVLVAIFWITLVAGIFSIVGLLTNISLMVFAVGNLFIRSYIYSFGDFHHPEALMIMTLFILALSPAGRVLSLDDVIRNRKYGGQKKSFDIDKLVEEKSSLAKWPILLIQWMYVLIYMSAALSKVGSSGLDWMNGSTLQFYLIRDGLRWGSELGVLLGQYYTLAVLLAWGAVLFEGTFFLVLVFPFLALFYIPVGVLMHTLIYLTQRAPFPEFIFIYAVFIPWVFVLQKIRMRSKPPIGHNQNHDSRAEEPSSS